MLLGDVADERRVRAHGHDLGAVADNARVLQEAVPVVVGLEGELGGVEFQESCLEAWPFRFDHAPGETGGEDAFRHLREHAVVFQLRERLHVGFGGEQLLQRLGAPLALLGAGADGLERGRHVSSPQRNRQISAGRGGVQQGDGGVRGRAMLGDWSKHLPPTLTLSPLCSARGERELHEPSSSDIATALQLRLRSRKTCVSTAVWDLAGWLWLRRGKAPDKRSRAFRGRRRGGGVGGGEGVRYGGRECGAVAEGTRGDRARAWCGEMRRGKQEVGKRNGAAGAPFRGVSSQDVSRPCGGGCRGRCRSPWRGALSCPSARARICAGWHRRGPGRRGRHPRHRPRPLPRGGP